MKRTNIKRITILQCHGADLDHPWDLGPIKELMKTYIKYPPRPLQSEGYSGPITITNFQRLESVREQLKKQGFTLNLGGQ